MQNVTDFLLKLSASSLSVVALFFFIVTYGYNNTLILHYYSIFHKSILNIIKFGASKLFYKEIKDFCHKYIHILNKCCLICKIYYKVTLIAVLLLTTKFFFWLIKIKLQDGCKLDGKTNLFFKSYL